LFKREGLLETSSRGQVTSWQAYFHSAGGSGFVYLKRPNDKALVERVTALLDALAGDPANGVEKIWTKADLDRIGSHPDASFAITMRPGFYTGFGVDELLVASSSKGGHGFDPARPEMRAALIMAGPDVPRVGDVGVVAMTRIAPTVARWFNVRLSPEADQPLTLGTGSAAQ
jgi:predicted AlkP superfamily pyrophosphatase or phosphodiesterase